MKKYFNLLLWSIRDLDVGITCAMTRTHSTIIFQISYHLIVDMILEVH
jgi:hypothetical protein